MAAATARTSVGYLNVSTTAPTGNLSVMLRWGVDLGGTKIEAVAVEDGSDEPVVKGRVRVDTEADGGYEHILDRIALSVEELSVQVGERAQRIGFGTPGTTDPSTGLLKNSNTVCLNGQYLWSDLIGRLSCEVVLANDANCFALAEATWGAARGEAVVFGVILGTGVGGGIVVRGQLLDGLHGIAGEWGHNVLDPDGESCYCGKRGCVETVISGPALSRHHERLTGERLTMREIALSQSAVAKQTVEHLISNFGRAIGPVINILDPDVVVLGGGVGQTPGLAERAAEAARPYVFNDAVRTRFVRPMLGDSAGVFGAAML